MEGVQSVRRASAVLDVVAKHGEKGCRLYDVVRQTDLGRATAHRFLKALQEVSLIDYDPERQTYYPGFRLITLANAASNRFGIARRLAPAMLRVAEKTGDTVYLSIRMGDDAVCIAREEGTYPIKTLSLQPGDRRPLGVGAGSLALLAFLPDEDVESILAASGDRMAKFGFDAASIREMVAQARRQGYALNPGRIIKGMSAIGVPVFKVGSTTVAALSVAAITDRMSEGRLAEIAAMLHEEARMAQLDLKSIADTLPTP
ncbi:MAG: IclR family transcriptional regulator [Rhizobiaceae bacterium]|nr:IclR family transcriptional regulator [Rhizobiaceae bacterium]